MKTVIILCMFLSGVSGLLAQNVLTGTCNMPLAGDSICRQEVVYVSPGGIGEGQVWDFSDLVYMEKAQDIHFCCDSDSIMLYACEPERVLKYQMNQDSLLLTGYETVLQTMTYQPSLTQLSFPCSFGDHVSQSFQGNGNYCMKYILESNGISETEADATGIICLSEEDTLRNVMRIHQIMSSAIRQYLPGDTLIDSLNIKQRIEEHYLWYARGYRYPIFETTSITVFNNMNPVSCQQRAYCTLPSAQQHLNDSVNSRILEADSLEQAYSQQPPIIHYTVSKEGSTLNIHYTLDADATISLLICDKMGLVYRRESATDSSGCSGTFQVDCNGLKPDIYILYMNVNGKIYSETIEI